MPTTFSTEKEARSQHRNFQSYLKAQVEICRLSELLDYWEFFPSI